ncbi:hypothetical protein LUTEI9C_100007 [Luteimonas sp. 9C]|nr:hypothetical protein LUTEI9C_100007 [Luteimonas sp. 9C]
MSIIRGGAPIARSGRLLHAGNEAG